jgi:hypothetical protein
MMKNQLVICFAMLSLSALISACSGSGQQLIAGTECPADYKPSFVDNPQRDIPEGNRKSIATKPDGTIDLPPGNYIYQHADFYYEDSMFAPDRNFRILMQDFPSADQTTSTAVRACVRNARPKMGSLNLAVNAKGLSKLTVGTDNKPTADSLEAKIFGFNIEPNGIILVTTNVVPSNQKPSLPDATFGPDEQPYIYVHPENSNLIEIRSQGKTADGSIWHLSTIFLRTDLPKAP